MSKTPPIALMLLPLPLLVALVVGVVLGLVSGSWIVAIIAGLLGGAAAGVAAFVLADRVALSLLRAHPLAPSAAPELRNQLEELCARTGVGEPDLYTVGPGAPAIASCGRNQKALVVSDGLTEDLTVVELEAAVARELARAKSGATTVDTLAVTFLTLPFGLVRGLADRALRFFRGGDNDARCDLDGIAITRYPPGMVATLAKMTDAPASSPAVRHLWAVGTHGDGGRPGTYRIEDRLELFREL